MVEESLFEPGGPFYLGGCASPILKEMQDLDASAFDTVFNDITDNAEDPLLALEESGKASVKKNDFEIRFGRAVSEEDIESAIKSRIPKNTTRNTDWAMGVWNSWCIARDINAVSTNVLLLKNAELADCLVRFIMEARRKDGKEYPPNTLYQIVVGIQRYIRENGKPSISFVDAGSEVFSRVTRVLDARMKQLTSKGLGSTRKCAQPLTSDQEATLWDKGIFSVNTADGLHKAVFWYSCKLFGLRAGDEHRSLCAEQFVIEKDMQGRYLRFIECSSKNVQGGLQQKNIQTKDLKVYEKPELGERDMVNVFAVYLASIPPTGPFYRRPIANSCPAKFSQQCVGRNTLSTVVSRFCCEAGFEGYYTNHSGKVLCATALFDANVDEQLIKRQTGHRSDAVRSYKRPGIKHDKLVSDTLQPPPPKKKVKTEDQPPNVQFQERSDMAPYNLKASSNPATKTVTLNFHFTL